jgi:hypothetical protein
MPVFRKDGRKILFVHVPKTGGSTIERVFKNSGYVTTYLDGRMGRDNMNHLRRSTPQHMEAELLRMLFRIDRFDLVFMMVRDPVRRLQSEYLWRTRRREVGVDGARVEAWAQQNFAKCKVDPHLHDNHIRPQADFYLQEAAVHYFEDGLSAIVEKLDEAHDLGLTRDVPRVREGAHSAGYSSKDVEITPSLLTQIQSSTGPTTSGSAIPPDRRAASRGGVSRRPHADPRVRAARR